jgi:hypothetical protein
LFIVPFSAILRFLACCNPNLPQSKSKSNSTQQQIILGEKMNTNLPNLKAEQKFGSGFKAFHAFCEVWKSAGQSPLVQP